MQLPRATHLVAGFQHREEAEQFLAELRERFARFGLQLHADKTRIVEFGRYAEHNRRNRGDGKPETFNFLGFTHSCGKTRKGHFTVLRQTMRQRWQAKLRALKGTAATHAHAYSGPGSVPALGPPGSLPLLRSAHESDRHWALFAKQWGTCGGWYCAVAVRVTICHGAA